MLQKIETEADALGDIIKKDEDDYINLKKDYVDVLKMIPSQNVDVKTETKVKSVEDIYKGWKEGVSGV